MRKAQALVWLVALACSPETAGRNATGTASAHADDSPPSPADSTSRAMGSSVPNAGAAPAAAPSADPTGPLLLTTDAGLVPAAKAVRVLHVGDSMAPLVGNYLRSIFWRSGRNYWVEATVSSSTLDWAGKRLLQDAMYKYDPDLILISLGSNELFDPRPERRGPAVKQIVADTRGRPCLWIGPPLWKKDTGFIELLKQNLGHCRYFDSSKLELPRMEDGRHPSWTGGYQWAAAVWRTLGGTDSVPTGSPLPKPGPSSSSG